MTRDKQMVFEARATPRRWIATACVFAVTGLLAVASRAEARDVDHGRIVIDSVHAAGLEKTVTHEDANRPVAVYLPPGYATAKKRYPVIYILHGVGGTEQDWIDDKGAWKSIQYLMDQGIAAGKIKEMILVMPNEHTRMFGSFYTDSVVTGRWEDFTARELVSYIDSKYRTISNVNSRGVAGHSMGGYGALRMAIKHADVYSVVYALSPAMPGWAGDLTIRNSEFIWSTHAKTMADIQPPRYAAGIVNLAQAFSPNPDKPPFYVDLPYAEVNGKVVPAEPAFSEWEANFISTLVPKYRANLQRLRGIRFDCGFYDQFGFIPPNAIALSQQLETLGIEHEFDEYNGDHNERLFGVDGRIYNDVLPYFSRLLEAEPVPAK